MHPTSVAVIGASSSPQKVGHMIFRNLVTQGFTGKVYAVNPKGEMILGNASYPCLAAIPGAVDMTVIVTPAPTVPGLLEECIAKDVTTAVIISAGFSETHTEEGKRLEQAIVDITNKRINEQTHRPRAFAKNNSQPATSNQQLRIIGPNCLGVLLPHIGLNASFAKDLPKAGNVSLISQSGALAVALIDQSISLNIGYAQIWSIGNKACLDECDYVEQCAEDPQTKVIGLYLESIKHGRKFLEIASRVGKLKPIVLLKSGVSDQGRRAASSHTGALAGSTASIDAACAQAGIHRAQNAEEFLMLLQTLSTQPLLRTNRIAVITNAGGPGILATDSAALHHLDLPTLDTKIAETLRKKLPAAASVGNPVDVLGDALEDRFGSALDAVGDDSGIDGVIVLLTPQVMTPVERIASAIIDFHARFPLMPVTTCFMGGEAVAMGRQLLRSHNLPTFTTPESAVKAMATLLPERISAPSKRHRSATRTKNAVALLDGNVGLLSEGKTAKLLALYGLSVPPAEVAHSPEEAVQIAKGIGYPVIAKISAPEILHKTDIGGVKGNLRNDTDVRTACQSILSATSNQEFATGNLSGILIQRFLPPGNEFIIGGIRDASFGPMVMVGLGGIYTELFKDTVFRIAPVSLESAYTMLTELRSWKLLLGMRGAKRSDIDALAKTVVAVSELLHECSNITELDINPVLVSEHGSALVDVKVVVGSDQ